MQVDNQGHCPCKTCTPAREAEVSSLEREMQNRLMRNRELTEALMQAKGQMEG